MDPSQARFTCDTPLDLKIPSKTKYQDEFKNDDNCEIFPTGHLKNILLIDRIKPHTEIIVSWILRPRGSVGVVS